MDTDITLTDGYILLRPLRDGDAIAAYQAVRESIPELVPWFGWADDSIALEDIERFVRNLVSSWEKGEVYNFAITEKGTGLYCGGCTLNRIDRGDHFANMAYWVRSSRTGRGIATAAVRLLAHFGFERLGLNRIEIVVAQGNRASMRVAEKAGAQREGHLRRRITVRGRVHDAVMYSLIPEDLLIPEQP